MSTSTDATGIFTGPPTCITPIITPEPCALNAEFQHFILRFNSFIFADTTERRGWKQAQRQGVFIDNSTVLKIAILWKIGIYKS
jgi:hypothetical protein